MYRYYSTQRPVAPGSYPHKSGCTVHNYDFKQDVPEIRCQAWGYVDYENPLTEKEAASYELLDGREKEWFGVITTIYDNGRVVAAIVDRKRAAVQPENTFTSTRRRDIYVDWYENMEAAQEAVKEARTA